LKCDGDGISFEAEIGDWFSLLPEKLHSISELLLRNFVIADLLQVSKIKVLNLAEVILELESGTERTHFLNGFYVEAQVHHCWR